MFALGLFLIVTGLLSIALGVALKKGSNPGKKGKKNKKKRDSQRSAPPPNPMGLYLGGVVFILGGVGFLVAYYT